MGLIDEFDAIAKQISQQQQWMTTEQATINVAIQPFIRALGYDTNNLAEVRPEYNADAKSSGSERVDYAIMRDGAPIIFIEAKASHIVLNENHWKQLHHYFNAEDLRFGILTNGLKFDFYSDLKKRNIMDKDPFLTIDMLNLDERLVRELEGFTKAGFDPERILSSARKLAVVRLLENEYQQPTREFAEYFAKQVYPGRMTQSVIEEFMPVFRQAWTQFVNQQISSHQPPVAPTETTIVEHKSNDSEYIPVYGNYEGHEFQAELRLESVRKGIFISSKAVKYNGKLMTSGDATWFAIRSIKPQFSQEDWKKEKINSWRFWHVVDPLDGSQRILRLVAGWKDNRDEALYRRILSN